MTTDLHHGKFVRAYLDNKMFGCGWRVFYVDKVTKKFVTLRDPWSTNATRVSKGEWILAAESAKPIKMRKGRLKDSIRKRLKMKPGQHFNACCRRMIDAC